MNISDWPLYFYRGTVSRVVDGDTIRVVCDLGMRTGRETSIRILAYNAPELFSGNDRENGAAARGYLETIVPVGTQVYLKTQKDRTTFDRYLADVWIEQEGHLVSIADLMLAGGYGIAA